MALFEPLDDRLVSRNYDIAEALVEWIGAKIDPALKSAFAAHQGDIQALLIEMTTHQSCFPKGKLNTHHAVNLAEGLYYAPGEAKQNRFELKKGGLVELLFQDIVYRLKTPKASWAMHDKIGKSIAVLLQKTIEAEEKMHQQFADTGKSIERVLNEKGFIPEWKVDGVTEAHFVSSGDMQRVLKQLEQKKPDGIQIMPHAFPLSRQAGQKDEDVSNELLAQLKPALENLLKQKNDNPSYVMVPVIIRGNHYVCLQVMVHKNEVEYTLIDSMEATAVIGEAFAYAKKAVEKYAKDNHLTVKGNMVCRGEQHNITDCSYYVVREIARRAEAKDELGSDEIETVKLAFAKALVKKPEELMLDGSVVIQKQRLARKDPVYEAYKVGVAAEQARLKEVEYIKQLIRTREKLPFVVDQGMEEAALAKNKEMIDIAVMEASSLLPLIKGKEDEDKIETVKMLYKQIEDYQRWVKEMGDAIAQMPCGEGEEQAAQWMILSRVEEHLTNINESRVGLLGAFKGRTAMIDKQLNQLLKEQYDEIKQLRAALAEQTFDEVELDDTIGEFLKAEAERRQIKPEAMSAHIGNSIFGGKMPSGKKIDKIALMEQNKQVIQFLKQIGQELPGHLMQETDRVTQAQRQAMEEKDVMLAKQLQAQLDNEAKSPKGPIKKPEQSVTERWLQVKHKKFYRRRR